MIPKSIILKAIEGGWRKDEQPNIEVNNDGLWVEFRGGGDTRTLHESDIALDPFFWRALGKVLEWRIVGPTKKDNDHNPEWYYQALEFYDLILTGGDTKKFWEEILSA